MTTGMDSIKNSGMSASELKVLKTSAKNVHSNAYSSAYYPRQPKKGPLPLLKNATSKVKRPNAGASYRGKGNGAFYPRKKKS